MSSTAKNDSTSLPNFSSTGPAERETPRVGVAILLALATIVPVGWPLGPGAFPADAASTPTGSAEATGGQRETPDSSPVLQAATAFTRGKLLEEEGDLEGALAAYELALDLDGSDPYAFLEVANLHVYLAQVSNSEKRLDYLRSAANYVAEARQLAPENLDILEHFAQTHLRLVEQNQFESLAIATEAYETLMGENEEPNLQVLTSLGQLYLWQRQDGKAAEVLRRASALRPGFVMLQRMLVEALLGAGETAEAEANLEELIELEPGSSEHRGRLAELRSQRGDHRGAVELLRDAAPELLDDIRMRRLLARELHLVGDNEEALAMADTLLADPQGGEHSRRLRVAIFNALARYDDAADELEPLLADSGDAEQRINDTLLMARLMERLGRDDQAAALLHELLNGAEPGDERQGHQVIMALIGVYERQGMDTAALNLLDQQIDASSTEAAVVFSRVKVGLLSRFDRLEEALETLGAIRRRLSEEDPQHDALVIQELAMLEGAERWDDLRRVAKGLLQSSSSELRDAAIMAEAEALAAEEHIDRALELLGKAEAENPESRRRFQAVRLDLLLGDDRLEAARPELEALAAGSQGEVFFAAQIYQQHERYDESIPLLSRLVEEVEDSRRPLFLLAAAHERRGDRKAAVESFERLLAEDPDYVPALNYLGYMWAEKGENLEEAHDLIRRAVANDPDNGAYVDSMGWVLYQLGRYDEARRHLEWAALLVDDDPTILEHLGDVYSVLDRLEEAHRAYSQALTLGADDEDSLRRKLDDLKQEHP